MNDLITLTCPKCRGQLHTESTRMKIYCQFCGTEILIKDFITERRIDKPPPNGWLKFCKRVAEIL